MYSQTPNLFACINMADITFQGNIKYNEKNMKKRKFNFSVYRQHVYLIHACASKLKLKQTPI